MFDIENENKSQERFHRKKELENDIEKLSMDGCHQRAVTKN